MITLRLSEEVAQTLKETLESYLSDLRMEIADTDNMDFREMLKRRKEALLEVVEALEPGESS